MPIEHADENANGSSEAGDTAGELKAMLAAIAEQIAASDRRHSDALVQMEDRIGHLNAQARSLRSRVPLQFAAAFERIEDGLTQLAERLADAATDRANNDRSLRTDAVSESGAADPPRGAMDDHARDAAPGRERVDQPAGSDDGDDTDAAKPGETGADPWAGRAAEALMELYESGEATFKPAGGAKQGANSRAVPKANAWLESRFGEIAARIETSLAQLRPESSVASLGQHFDRFEARLGVALQDVASRSDLKGLSDVETHINQLAGRIEHAQTHLARLDGIETQLQDVVARLSDDRLEGLFDGKRSDAQLEAMITAAAEKISTQIANLPPASGQASSGIDDMRDLLEAFITERRQNEETNALTLDALQQAMIGLLDRMDSLEVTRSPAQLHAEAVDAMRPSRREAVQDVEDDSILLDADDRRVFSRDPGTAGRTPPQADEPGKAPEFRAGRVEVSSPDVATVASRIIDRRKDFIADAKRAKLKAEADAEANVTIRRATPNGAAAGTAAIASRIGSGDATFFGIPRRRLLVSALALLLIIPSALMLHTHFSGGTAETAEPAEGAPTGADGEQSQLPQDETRSARSGDAPEQPETPVLNEGSLDQEEGAAAPAEGELEAPPQAGTPPDDMGSENVGRPEPRALYAPAGDVPLDGVVMLPAEQPLTLEDLDGVAMEKYMASLSQSIGEYAATPGEMARDPGIISTAMHATANPVVSAEAPSSSALDLPPATVGPLSLRLAAAKGDPSAEFEVGARLAEGKGVDQNFKEAARWYQRSASRGFAQAQYRLGTLYERGIGMKSDINRARTWYKRAAEQGNVKAMHNLAVLSAGQATGSPDYNTAVRWFNEAAARGVADSQFNLAVLYENGLGVPKDMVQAFMWISVASRSGDPEALKRRDELKAAMDPSDVSKSDLILAKWRATPVDALANDARLAGEDWKKRQVDSSDS